MSSGGHTRAFTASKTLKRSLNFFIFAAIALVALSIFLSTLFTEDVVIKAEQNARESLDIQWNSYQHYYINAGRVVRPKNDFDTVSEGQAYAMMRAVRQNDRAAFDQLYRWTEENLSRLQGFGDHLLSWRYGTDKLGSPHVLDPNPAIDADLDYALALFAAARRWTDGKAPTGMTPYKEKATLVSENIMARAVVLHPNGELVLLPWPTNETGGQEQRILLNPSYWSPGHYRVFEQETGNRRWGKLASDTYRQFGRLLGGVRDPVVAVPDWIVMRPDGSFTTDPSRGYVSGWDAFRAWWRVRLDYDLTGNARARELIEGRLAPFLDKSMAESGGEVASESERDGTPTVKRPNPGMTAVYAWAMRDFNPVLSRSLARQSLRRLYQDGDYLYFTDRDDYYTNSWAWLALTESRLAQPFAGLLDNMFSNVVQEEHP
ncbi:MAG: hypothetical protein LIP23_08860 [Planctomycetes bacterium]|nr:hypothetical protein [Planctomycetota bacterium]